VIVEIKNLSPRLCNLIANKYLEIEYVT